MDKVEEVLPRITEFLRDELARESLSSRAESTRLFYVERIKATLQESETRKRTLTNELPCSTDRDGKSAERPTGLSVPPGQPVTHKSRSPTYVKHVSAASSELSIGQLKFGTYDEVVFKSPGKDQLSSYCNEGDRESFSSDDESSTDYESYGDSSNSLNNLYDHIGPAATGPSVDAGGSLDSRKQVRVHKRSSRRKASSFPNTAEAGITRAGFLYHKGKLKMSKRYCIISGSWLLSFTGHTELKPVMGVELPGYEAVLMNKDPKQVYHELRLSCPGRETYWFYSTELEYLITWIKALNLAASTRSSVTTSIDTNPPVPPVPGRSNRLAHPKSEPDNVDPCFSSENSTGESMDKTSVVKIERIASGRAIGNGGDAASKKPVNMMKTIKNAFGWMKSNAEKKMGRDVSEICDPSVAIADYMFIASDYVSGKPSDPSSLKWDERYCAVRNGRLEVYKEQGDTKMEFSSLLAGADILLPDSDMKKEFVLKLRQQQKEIYLHTENAAEYGRWLNVLIKETGFANRTAGNKKQSQIPITTSSAACDSGVYLYDEILQYNLVSSQGIPPPVPSSPPPSISAPNLQPEDYLEPQDFILQLKGTANPLTEQQDDIYLNRYERFENECHNPRTGNDVVITGSSKELKHNSDSPYVDLYDTPHQATDQAKQQLPLQSSATTSTNSSTSNRAKLSTIGRLSQSDDALSKVISDSIISSDINDRGDQPAAVRTVSALDVQTGETSSISELSDASKSQLSPTLNQKDDKRAEKVIKLKPDGSYITGPDVSRKPSLTAAGNTETACIRSALVKERLKIFQGSP